MRFFLPWASSTSSSPCFFSWSKKMDSSLDFTSGAPHSLAASEEHLGVSDLCFGGRL